MDWSWLSFLAEPWFVIPWYLVGAAGAIAVAVDIALLNTPLKTAMKWAWPIIVVFFSVIGLALYITTARAPRVGQLGDPDAKEQAHAAYERNMLRRVNGAVIHCVAGDGLGIMTGMVIARAARMSFWQEFWFEYAVGFAFGLFIFQFKSMKMMTESNGKALAMAFRAEFFSMLTVMAGMGAVMAYVTAMAVGAQPRPLTYAFWGFGALGLVVGYVCTFPMNWMMVKLGWKHGMGSARDAHPVQRRSGRVALLAAMIVLGCGALIVPAWASTARAHRRVEVAAAPPSAVPSPPLARLASGLHESVMAALAHLDDQRGTAAAIALDAAKRAAETAHHAAPAAFAPALQELERARRAVWDGREADARRHLTAAAVATANVSAGPLRPEPNPGRYAGVPLLDARGNQIGELEDVHGDRARLAIGGARDLWGFVDLRARRELDVPTSSLVFGPDRTVGWSYVALPVASADLGG